MKALFANRQAVQKVSGDVALAIDDLVSANNVQPLEIGESKIRSGTGTPEGRYVGSPGDVWLRTDGASGTVSYIKATGKNSKFGWVLNGAGRGTWIPTDLSGAGLAVTGSGVWVAKGAEITVYGTIGYPVTASGAGAIIGGLPFPCGLVAGGGVTAYTNVNLAFTLYVREIVSRIELFTLAGVAITNVQMSNKLLVFTATYLTAL
jgi:hypothetical protein